MIEAEQIINKTIFSRGAQRLLILLTIGIILSLFIVLSANVSAEASVCCEKTIYGAYCQNVPAAQCLNSSQQVPTSCEATSFCKMGCCYDSDEGLCLENTPKEVCEVKGGSWSDDKKCNTPQCKLGCCVLGTQAAYVGLVRCKRLSAFYGLTTDFRTSITNEDACIALAQATDEGACVYEKDYDLTCKFTTRQGCQELSKGGLTNVSIKFYKDYLCSNPDLNVPCGMSEKTTCIKGKDEVYFVDTCGNPANIYDATKTKDVEYWKKIIPKSQSCGAGKANDNSKTCGNCDYFQGSMCREAKLGDANPTYGDNICRNLDCKKTSLGKTMKHGESWCAYDSKTGNGTDVVGSQHFRHICLFGEELVEPCADYRQEVCIQDKITTTQDGGTYAFSQAGCIVNRWQDCLQQEEEDDCLNTDKRDCFWLPDITLPATSQEDAQPTSVQPSNFNPVLGSPITGNSILGLGGDDSSASAITATKMRKEKGACLPNNPPGLKFWESDGEATAVCGQVSQTIAVTYEKKGIMGGSYECSENCHALTEDYAKELNGVCATLGDCGIKVNLVGEGKDGGFNWKIDGKKNNKIESLSKGIITSMKTLSKPIGFGSSSGAKGGIWGWG